MIRRYALSLMKLGYFFVIPILSIGIKDWSRDFLAALMRRSGLASPRRLSRESLLILTFHRVLPSELARQYPLPGLAVTPEGLRWVLGTLRAHFEVLPVSEAWGRLVAKTEGTFRRPLLSISFDDGQWDNVRYAAPVLAEMGVRATFYVPVAAVETAGMLWHDRLAFSWASPKASLDLRERWLLEAGLDLPSADTTAAEVCERLKSLDAKRRQCLVDELTRSVGADFPQWARMATWDEVAALSRQGHEIGSHALSHELLSQLAEDDQHRELDESKRVIEQRIGVEVRSVCYPNGDFDERTVRISRRLGYETGVTTRWGVNRVTAPPLMLRRCDMDARRLVNRKGGFSADRLHWRLFVPGVVR